MSGNSSRSSLRTSPIEWCGVRMSVPVTLHEREAIATDLHLVAVAECTRLDALAVHVRAVQRALVVDEELVSRVAPHAHVSTRHGDVVEEDLRVGVPPD